MGLKKKKKVLLCTYCILTVNFAADAEQQPTVLVVLYMSQCLYENGVLFISVWQIWILIPLNNVL